MSGWIKIHRRFLDWEWFDETETVHLFLFLLLNANHKDSSWRGNKIKRGQFITSRSMLSTKMKLSQQRVRTILKNLENTQEISTQTTNKYTVITICKYDSYQSVDSDINQQITIKQPTVNHQLTTNKNDKKEKNNKELILDSWIEYRKQIKKPIKEATRESILAKMENFTEKDCKFVINNSIENGWQGLFWDKLPKHELTDDQQHYNNIMAKLNYKSNPDDFK